MSGELKKYSHREEEKRKKKAQMLRHHKAAKTLCISILSNDRDYEWTRGKISQNSYMDFWEETEGAPKPILLAEDLTSD